MKTGYHKWVCGFVLLLFAWACRTTSLLIEEKPQKEGNYYSSAFPVVDVSDKLYAVNHSLLRVASSVNYRRSPVDEERAVHHGGFLEDRMGTGVIIAQNEEDIYLLTTRQLVDLPDTLWHGSVDSSSGKRRYANVKVDESKVVMTNRNLCGFEVVAMNNELALIKAKRSKLPDLEPAASITLRLGNAHNLRLGSFVFVMGFPEGQPIIERGIVSSPNQTEAGDFLTDALYNDGISGGVVLASNDNFHSFEWVGIINSSAAIRGAYLVPESEGTSSLYQPYGGPLKIRFERSPHSAYGITRVISAETIINFLQAYGSPLTPAIATMAKPTPDAISQR